MLGYKNLEIDINSIRFGLLIETSRLLFIFPGMVWFGLVCIAQDQGCENKEEITSFSRFGLVWFDLLRV